MTSAPAKDLSSDRQPLSRERIIEAAVALVDEQGVEALSMRRLGAALGVEAMSIYNHIPNKDTLLKALVQHVLAQIEIPPQEDDWAERLKRMSRSYRSLALRHPHFVQLIASRPYSGLPALRQVETIFEILEAGGFEESQWMDIVRTVSSFAIGFTLSEVSGFMEATDESPETDVDYDQVMDEFPRLVRMLPYFEGMNDAEQFEYGLDLFIAGLKRKLEQ